MSEMIEIAKIRRDGGTQSRVNTDYETVASYAEAMKGGVEFPAVTVVHDGENYWLADGFHRLQAAQRIDRKEIMADVIQGTQRDAILYSAGANATHGLRRTNEDKRRAVLRLLNDAEWVQWSNREISRRTGVTDVTVGNIRKQLEKEQKLQAQTTRIGADGRAINTNGIGAKEKKPWLTELIKTWRNGLEEKEVPFIYMPDGKYLVLMSWTNSTDRDVLQDYHIRARYYNIEETDYFGSGGVHFAAFDQPFVDHIGQKNRIRCINHDDLPVHIKAVFSQAKIEDTDFNWFEQRTRSDYFQPGQLVATGQKSIGLIKNFKPRHGRWNVDLLGEGQSYPSTIDVGQRNLILLDTTPTPETAETLDDILVLLEALWKNEPNEAAAQHVFFQIAKRCYQMTRFKKGKSS